MEESGTYLEEFLLSLEMLPNDIRRDFELMKELDKECMELSRELQQLESGCLRSVLAKRKATYISGAGAGGSGTGAGSGEPASTTASTSAGTSIGVEGSAGVGGEGTGGDKRVLESEADPGYVVRAEGAEGAEGGEGDDEQTRGELHAIELLRERTRQKLSEKVAIAENLGIILDRFCRKLDTDLAFFETQLKVGTRELGN
ncbi:hypothetical protein B484DRAFT_447573 [Ochromonadaceae sp. CCMP2298]|nr:hypothetical protein B484DRAFT_447573 [Ochromonadaceae sp. CCMP2298]